MAFEERGQLVDYTPSSTLAGSSLFEYMVEKVEYLLRHKPTIHDTPEMTPITHDTTLEDVRIAVGPFQLPQDDIRYTTIQLTQGAASPKSAAPAHHATEPVFIKMTVRNHQLVALASHDSDIEETRFVIDPRRGGLDLSHLREVVIAMDTKAAAMLEAPLAIKKATTPQSVMFPMPIGDIVDPRSVFALTNKEIQHFEDQLALKRTIEQTKKMV